MGMIQLENMDFYAYHGCYKEEQIVGNHFKVDLTLHADCQVPARTDDIDDALNYLKVYEFIKEEMKEKSHLLEHVAKRILDRLYREFDQIEKAVVKVRKMNPPLGGHLESVSVTLSR